MNDPLRINRRQWNGLALAGLGSCLGGELLYADEPVAPSATAADPAPLPFVEGSFTIAVLPDTQMYCERWPEHFHSQADWIVANKDRHNIQFVVHLGDITNRNTPPQWEVAQASMKKLDGVVPYSLALGNHDLGPGGNCTTRETYLNEYFPLSVAEKSPTLAGLMDERRLDNSYHTFSAAGRKFLVLALEFGPRDEVVAWADAVVANHPDHWVLLTTHAYMYFDDTRYDWAKYGVKQKWNPHSYGTSKLDGGTNDAQQLWDKLIVKHKNFFMTLNGHVLEDGLGRLSSENPAGGQVHQMLVNYQMKKEGGEGYLRLVEFLPDGKSVQIKAYSPSLDHYKTDEQNQFVLELDPACKAS